MSIHCICTQYLVGPPFALITASIRHGMEVLLEWYESPGLFDRPFFCLLFLVFLLTIPHRFSIGFRSGEFAGQSSTPTQWSFNQLLVLWQCGQVPNPAGQQKEARRAPKCLGKRVQ